MFGIEHFTTREVEAWCSRADRRKPFRVQPDKPINGQTSDNSMIAGWRDRARQLRVTAHTQPVGETRSILEKMADQYDGMVERAEAVQKGSRKSDPQQS